MVYRIIDYPNFGDIYNPHRENSLLQKPPKRVFDFDLSGGSGSGMDIAIYRGSQVFWIYSVTGVIFCATDSNDSNLPGISRNGQTPGL